MSTTSAVGSNEASGSSASPTQWFAPKDDQLQKFQILFSNLQQIMAFGKGEKPIITDGVITVDHIGGKFRRYFLGAFNTAFIEEQLTEALRVLKTGEAPIQRHIAGKTLKRTQAWNVQKAFQIAQLVSTLKDQQAHVYNAHSLQAGMTELMLTYQNDKKTVIVKELNRITENWLPKIEIESARVLKNRARIDKIHELWEQVLKAANESQASSSGTSLKFPATLKNPLTSHRRGKRGKAKKSSHSSSSSSARITENSCKPKNSQGINLNEPLFDETVSRMRKDPHKEIVKKAPLTFLEIIKERLQQVRVNDAKGEQILLQVEANRQKRLREIAKKNFTQSTQLFNSNLLQKVLKKSTVEVDVEVEDECDETQMLINEFEIIEKAKVIGGPVVGSDGNPRVLRSTSMMLSTSERAHPPLRSADSEVFDQNLIREALSRKFSNCLNTNTDSDSDGF